MEYLPLLPSERGENLQPEIRGSEDSSTQYLPKLEVLPLDEWNIKLLDNVHPPIVQEVIPEGVYNIVVIGAGAAGLVTAAGSSGVGAKVAIIENNLFGGDCLNVGCVPSKALLRVANGIGELKKLSSFGVEVGEVKINFEKIMERMRRLRAQISPNDSVSRFQKELGIDVYLGFGKFVNKDTIEVNGKRIKFAKACIATGASPNVPPIPGIETVPYLTNITVFNLTSLPPKLAIIGAGPVSCELAQAFARFGSQVLMIARSPKIMEREDPDASQIVFNQLLEDGVQILLNSKVTSIQNQNSDILLSVDEDGKPSTHLVSHLLVAAGRSPNVNGMGLEEAGVEYTPRGVKVNKYLQTTNSNIYAAGDVCLQYKFTHTADFSARIVIRNALFFGKSRFSDLVVPWCTYTEPELAHVGLYESDLIRQGIKYQTFIRHFHEVDRAILEDETQGFVKVFTKDGSDKILGATIVGPHAGEMISEFTQAMVTGTGLSTISTVIHPYPTESEAIRQVGDLFNRTKLTPTVKVLFRKLLQTRK